MSDEDNDDETDTSKDSDADHDVKDKYDDDDDDDAKIENDDDEILKDVNNAACSQINKSGIISDSDMMQIDIKQEIIDKDPDWHASSSPPPKIEKKVQINVETSLTPLCMFTQRKEIYYLAFPWRSTILHFLGDLDYSKD